MCQADERDLGEASSEAMASSSLDRSAEAKQILRLEREIKTLRFQLGEAIDGDDKRLMLLRLRADSSIEDMDRARLLEKIADLEAKYRFADLDACVTHAIRETARKIFVGNCTFVDDDLHLLASCAIWALKNGIPDDECPHIFPKAKANLAALGKDQCTPSEERSDEALPAALSKPDKNYKEEDSDDGLIV